MLPLARALALLASLNLSPTAPIVVRHQAPVGNAFISDGYTDGTTIYLNDNGTLTRDHDPIVLASVLAHEQYHVNHGPTERPAYAYQIEVLRRLGGSPRIVARLEHAMEVR